MKILSFFTHFLKISIVAIFLLISSCVPNQSGKKDDKVQSNLIYNKCIEICKDAMVYNNKVPDPQTEYRQLYLHKNLENNQYWMSMSGKNSNRLYIDFINKYNLLINKLKTKLDVKKIENLERCKKSFDENIILYQNYEKKYQKFLNNISNISSMCLIKNPNPSKKDINKFITLQDEIISFNKYFESYDYITKEPNGNKKRIVDFREFIGNCRSEYRVDAKNIVDRKKAKEFGFEDLDNRNLSIIIKEVPSEKILISFSDSDIESYNAISIQDNLVVYDGVETFAVELANRKAELNDKMPSGYLVFVRNLTIKIGDKSLELPVFNYCENIENCHTKKD